MTNCDFLREYNNILTQCQKPSRYVGNEFLSMNKDFDSAKSRVAMLFPDKYEIGISNFGHKILYHVINQHPDLMADRVYAPDLDFLTLLQKENKPLYGLESKKPLIDFDFLAVALQYELAYPTLLKLLECSFIPIYSKDRTNEHPIVFAGGPCAYNPMPLYDFVDVFSIGDGEEVVVEVIQKAQELKGKDRFEILKELSNIDGVFCPMFPKKTKKRVFNLDSKLHPTSSPIPHFASVHDRAIVEIRRGCGRLCRFCQSGHTNLPIRERKADEIVRLAQEYVKNTGYDEYSLLSLSSNDHTNIEVIIDNLNNIYKDCGISVSLPSQRADKFSLNLANLISDQRKPTITLAPEAGSQRMRDVINKNLTEEQIVNAALSCLRSGFDKMKFYFVIGLPFEQDEDLIAIVELLRKIVKTAKYEKLRLTKITCSLSVFVPKPHTPFMFCGQNSTDEINRKIDLMIKEKSDLKNVRLNFHTPRVSQIEAYYSRADKSASNFVYELYKRGAYLDSYEENIDFDLYNNVAKDLNIDLEKEATKQYNGDSELPWDLIDSGLDKQWLVNSFNKAKEACVSPSCDSVCTNCGVCVNLNTKKQLDNKL